MRALRPIDQTEIGHRAFTELAAEEHIGADIVIWNRASEELKQHYFDRRIPREEQAYLRQLIEGGPPT